MRKFLVVLDDSRECLNAMRYAALRASHTGGGVTILSIVPPDEFQTWVGVADLMRAEARDRIEAHFEVFAKWMRDKQGVNPELVVREGDREVRSRPAGDRAVAQLGQSADPDHHRSGRHVERAVGEHHLTGL